MLQTESRKGGAKEGSASTKEKVNGLESAEAESIIANAAKQASDELKRIIRLQSEHAKLPENPYQLASRPLLKLYETQGKRAFEEACTRVKKEAGEENWEAFYGRSLKSPASMYDQIENFQLADGCRMLLSVKKAEHMKPLGIKFSKAGRQGELIEFGFADGVSGVDIRTGQKLDLKTKPLIFQKGGPQKISLVEDSSGVFTVTLAEDGKTGISLKLELVKP